MQIIELENSLITPDGAMNSYRKKLAGTGGASRPATTSPNHLAIKSVLWS